MSSLIPKISKILIVLSTISVLALFVGILGSKFGFRSPAFAFFLNWIVMSGVAILGGVFSFSSLLPASYFSIKEGERCGRAYSVLGVRHFKRILLGGPLAFLNPTIRLQGNRASLGTLASKMREAEAAHLLVFSIVILSAGCVAGRGWWDSVAWLLLFNVVLNLYPIMLQRYNRQRLERIIKAGSRR